MNTVSVIACIGIVGSLLQLFPVPAYADPCADYKLELSRGYVYNCGHQYQKMVVNDPTGTLLNVRQPPKGTIIRKLANVTFTWMNVTRSNKEFGSNPQWVYIGYMVCDFTCFIPSGVAYAPYLLPADP